MGLEDPRFYYYPDGSTLYSVNLNEPLTQLDDQLLTTADSAPSSGFVWSAASYGGAWAVRIVLERFRDTGDTRRRSLVALIDHLQRGEWVAFSADHAKTWGGNITSAPSSGDTSFVATNDFTALNAAGTIASADNLVVQSPNPDGFREKVRVGTWTPGTGVVTLLGGTAIQFDHVATTLARWEFFWPRLVLDPAARNSGRLLTNEYQNVWTLDLPLITAPKLEHDAITQG